MSKHSDFESRQFQSKSAKTGLQTTQDRTDAVVEHKCKILPVGVGFHIWLEQIQEWLAKKQPVYYPAVICYKRIVCFRWRG